MFFQRIDKIVSGVLEGFKALHSAVVSAMFSQ